MNKARDYEILSRAVWQSEKSTILSREKWNAADPNRFDGYLATLFGAGIPARFDAFLLHSALVAQKRGYKKFIFNPELEVGGLALVHFVEPEDEEKYAEFTLDAGKLVAELSPAIPDPETLKAIKAERKRKKKNRK